MVSNKEIKEESQIKGEKADSIGYIICDNCGGYYQLQSGESPDDFTACECGGNLIQRDGLKKEPLKKSEKFFCTSCHTENVIDAHFCKQCGNKLINEVAQNSTQTYLTIENKSNYIASLTSEGVHVNIPLSSFKKARKVIIKYDEIIYFDFKLRGTLYGMVEIQSKNSDKSVTIKSIHNHLGNLFINKLKEIISTGTINLPNYTINTENIPIYAGNVDKSYKVMGTINARADSSLLSKTATMKDVNARLREETLKMGGNAVINAKYDRSSSQSWRGVKAKGIAVFIESDEKKCPFCAEIVKKEAIKCKHCGNDLSNSENNHIKEVSHEDKQSQADELRKFAQLRDEGIITEEEFESKKKEILGL